MPNYNSHIVRVAMVVAFALLGVAALAGPEVPKEGLKAEVEKRWDDAVKVYKDVLEKEPARGDLWQRIAQIENAQGNKEAVAEAWQRASDLEPEDTKLLFTLAKAHAAAGNGQAALSAVGRAVKLAPKSVELLRARAMYANWIGKPEIAADSYRRILAEDPDDKEALAGLKSTLAAGGGKDYEKIAASIEKKIEANPDDPKLRAELAQVYSMANRPADALEAINGAVELDPENVDYLRARGQYANWTGSLKVAEDSYMRIIEIAPDDADAMINLARAKSWGGHLDESVALFKKYTEAHPEDRDALMDYIKVQSWRGNFSVAMDLLELYRERFKETLEYRKQKARLLASADKPSAAQDVITPLLDVASSDYEVYFSRAAAFHFARQRKAALQSLEVMEDMRPKSKENEGLRRFVMSGIRHSVYASGEFYSESDGIDIETYKAHAGVQVSPTLRLMGGYEWKTLMAEPGSGLESVDGRDPIYIDEAWGGVNWLVFPRIDLIAKVGHTDAMVIPEAENQDLTSFRYIVDYRADDALSVSYTDDKHLHAVSPRAVSQGIYKRNQALRAVWTPGLQATVDIGGSQAKFSDGNRQWEAYFAPRQSFVRNQDLNLDLGFFFWWQAFEDQEFNGYYAPDFYERYMIRANGYWKINDHNGVSFSLAGGVQRDEAVSTEFDWGSGGDIEGQFGLTADWMLKARAGYTHNLNSTIGAFDAQVYSLSIERMF